MFALTASAQQLSREQAVEDVKAYIQLLEETHPDPYTRFGGIPYFKIKAQLLEESLPADGCSVGELRRMLSAFSSQLRDGHTNIRGGVESSRQVTVGCRLSLASDAIFIRQVAEGYDQRLVGSKLVAVEGKPVDELLELAATFIACENESDRRYTLATTFLGSYEYVKLLFPAMDSSLTYTLVTPQGDTVERAFEWKDTGSLVWKDEQPKREGGLFSYRFLDKDKKVAYFPFEAIFSQEAVEMLGDTPSTKGIISRITKHYYPELVEKYGEEEAIKRIPYLSEVFREALEAMKANHSEYLVIDLRRNDGGMTPIVKPMLYLLYGDRAFALAKGGGSVRKLSPLYLKKWNVTIDEFNSRNGTDFKVGDYWVYYEPELNAEEVEQKGKEARLEYLSDPEKTKEGWLRFIQDLDGKPIYSPKVVVLTSAYTFSAAYHLLYYIAKIDPDALTVGIAPSQAGNTPMEVTPFTLANSKLEGSISNYYQIMFPADDPRAEQFDPTYPMTWEKYKQYGFSIAKDAPLLYVMDLIGKKME